MTHASLPDRPSRADGSPPRLTVGIADATKMLGIGRSKLYELIGAGEVETIKIGTATLIIVDSNYALVRAHQDRQAAKTVRRAGSSAVVVLSRIANGCRR